ncbi:MAG TPA: type II secretion system protein [Verrucomicrobiae bacterium]|nr:type II secretion system protein [Verrucomicrobiae bacterium]
MKDRTDLKTRGFTFTELLVVVSVGAVLAGTILPALDTAQDTLKAAVCLSNMHQWGLGFSLYAADQRDYWPAEGSNFSVIDGGPNLNAWFNVVPPYLKQAPLIQYYEGGTPPAPLTKSIWICPSATNRTVSITLSSPYFTYAFNSRMDPNGAAQFQRGQCVAPATTILFAEEAEDGFCNTTGRFAPARHFDGGNFVLCDGHAEWIAYTNFCRQCPANPFTDSNSTATGDWKTGVPYHWFPFKGAST